jgi:hypothetical protein
VWAAKKTGLPTVAELVHGPLYELGLEVQRQVAKYK